jgi:hypothetical protein
MINANHSSVARIEAAESIIALLAQLNVSKFPWEERIPLAVSQMTATREWIEAIRSVKANLRFQRLFYRRSWTKLKDSSHPRTVAARFLSR